VPVRERPSLLFLASLPSTPHRVKEAPAWAGNQQVSGQWAESPPLAAQMSEYGQGAGRIKGPAKPLSLSHSWLTLVADSNHN